ncbi:MAG: TMEM175 family protein, partial [Methyloceanibacter sp.]
MTLLRRATPERLSAFSDGVFAVLITVLVLDLRPPEQPTFKALLSL